MFGRKKANKLIEYIDRYFALHIENLSKGAECVADQLAVMAIRRTL